MTTRRELLAAAAGALALPLGGEAQAQGAVDYWDTNDPDFNDKLRRLYATMGRRNRIVRVWEEQVPMPVREFYWAEPPEHVGKITPRTTTEFYSVRWSPEFLELPSSLKPTFRLIHVEVEVEVASKHVQVMAEHPEQLPLSLKPRYRSAPTPLYTLPPEDGDERLALQAVAAQVSRTAHLLFEDEYSEDMVRQNISDGKDLLHVRVQGSDGVRHAVMPVWSTFTVQDLRWRILQTTEQLFG